MTPARLDGISPGTHELRLEAEGYAPWRGEVVVREGRVTTVDATLDLR